MGSEPFEFYGEGADRLRDVARKAWNALRNYGPADLRAVRQHLQERIEDDFLPWKENAAEKGDQAEYDRASRLLEEARQYRWIAFTLLERRLVEPGEAPEWENLTEEEQRHRYTLADVPDDVRFVMTNEQKRDVAMHREYWRRRDEGEPAQDLLTELGNRYGLEPDYVRKRITPRKRE